MPVSKNTGGRKLRKKHRKKKDKAPEKAAAADAAVPSQDHNEEASNMSPEESDRARRARRHRHHEHHKKNKSKKGSKQTRQSSDDEESRAVEDTSSAVLASAVSTSQNFLSRAASRASASGARVVRFLIGSHPSKIQSEFREWIPMFPKSYGYSSLLRYASVSDYTLMTIGALAAIVAGCCIPTTLYFLGTLIRVIVFVEKMSCISNGSCSIFLANCDQNFKNQFGDKELLQRPLNSTALIDKHMKRFIELELTVTFVYTICSSIYFFCWSYASHNQGGKLKRAYFQSLLRKDMTWYEAQRKNPDAISRTMENTRRIVEIGESIPTAISLTVMTCLCTGMTFYHGWELTLVCLIIVPLLLFTLRLMDRCKAAKVLKVIKAYRVAHSLTKEVFAKMRTVIGYGTQSTEQALYNREITRNNNYVTRAIVRQSVAVGLMYLVNFGVWAGIFWNGMRLVYSNDVKYVCSDKALLGGQDVGDFVLVLLSLLFGCANLYTVIIVVGAVQVSKLCGREVLKIIDGPNGIDNMGHDGCLPEEPLYGKVEFVNVRFTYPQTKQGLSLSDFSFVAEANTMVAIVGVTNSGKSTALKLICKEYLADSGYVLVDGQDIRSLNTQWLRAHIGYVDKELSLFDISIEDNVRMGKLDANFFQIQEACIKAGAHDFIINFKEGYQTRIGLKGNRLTPGQKQLLAIARAIIRDPRILLLDEVTDDLDSHSVIELMQSLRKIALGRTVILVSHRLATVVHSDMIYVLKNGKLVEKGDHRQLISANGAYSQLCRMDQTSKSYQPDSSEISVRVDSSEMAIISSVKTFNQKPILPNLYNSLIGVDPVVSQVAHTMIKSDKDTERGFHEKLEWVLEVGEELADNTNRQEEYNLEKGLREASSSPSYYEGSTSTTGETFGGTSINNTPAATHNFTRIASKDPIDDEFQSISLLSTSKSTWIRMLTMASTNPWLITCGVVSSMFLSIAMPLFGLLFAVAIDVMATFTRYPDNWQWAEYFDNSLISFPDMIPISLAVLGLYSGVFAFLQEFCLNLAGYKSVQKVRRLLYGCMLSQDTSFFEHPENTPIALASVLFQDTDAIQHVTFGLYATSIHCFCTFIVVLILCMMHTMDLTGYTFLVMLLTLSFNFFDGWLAKKEYGKTISALQQMSSLIVQVFRNKHVITVCQMESYYLTEFNTLQRKLLRTSKGLSCLRVITFGLGQSAMFWGFGLILHIGQDRMRLETYTLFDLIITGFIFIFGLRTIGTNFSVVMSFEHVNKGGKRIMDIIMRTPLMQQDDSLKITGEDCTKEIEFVNTHFWKPHTPDLALLKGINFTIQPQQVTAIVGYPESGKSGFLELLGKYYEATGGLVTIAGKDLRYVTADSLREHVSIIPRQPELFSRTVAQNIALGAAFRRPSMDEVIQAAKEANVHSLIVSLPEGYETRIGGEHDYLSQSQKQRICIARALLKNPKILIYVCNSTLGVEGEKTVLEAIMGIKVNRTVILLSHRIQPVQAADWIVVMEKGYLEEQGNHANLLQRRSDGIYAHMWRSQNPLQDDNFLKGNIVFSGKSRFESLKGKQSRSKSRTQITPGNANVPGDDDNDDEVEAPAPRCGFFRIFGRGIVDPTKEGYHDGEGVNGDGATN